jgi:propanediol dehydratase large subunit
MSKLFSDTRPEAERVLIELLRCATVTRKLEMLGQMNAAARMLALQGLRARHPDATEAQLQRYLADLLLGSELAARAYGPRPAEVSDAA